MPLRDSNGPDGFAFSVDRDPPTMADLLPFIDEARDWVNLNCPDLDGKEWDAKVLVIAKDFWYNQF